MFEIIFIFFKNKFYYFKVTIEFLLAILNHSILLIVIEVNKNIFLFYDSK